MINPKCKTCRRIGEKLFLKGERCLGVKCALTKRKYPPGLHGPKGQPRLTDYGLHLKEKQKLKKTYGISEKQMRNYFSSAVKMKADTGLKLIEFLERRLDNVIYRLNLASSRRQARQMVSHALFLINNKKVDIPSYQIKNGQTISVRRQDKKDKSRLEENIKNQSTDNLSEWLTWDKEKKQAKVVSLPTEKDLNIGVDIRLVVEFYSK